MIDQHTFAHQWSEEEGILSFEGVDTNSVSFSIVSPYKIYYKISKGTRKTTKNQRKRLPFGTLGSET